MFERWINNLSSFGINPLAIYHECRSLMGYATYYLFRFQIFYSYTLFTKIDNINSITEITSISRAKKCLL